MSFDGLGYQRKVIELEIYLLERTGKDNLIWFGISKINNKCVI